MCKLGAALAIVIGISCSVFNVHAAEAQTVTEPENASCGNEAARDAIANIESTGSGGYTAVNSVGFLGRYQIGEAKLQDLGYSIPDGNSKDNKFTWSAKANALGINSNQDFLNNPAVQESIYGEVNELNVKYLGSAMNNVGKSLSCGGTVSKGALLAGSQLGAGKVQAYFNNGGVCIPGKATATNDANGVCVEKFMCAVAGCKSIEKDMSKKTCDVVMPMLEAISCSNYAPALQGFCSTYRPYLMTRGECADAEQMSKGTPMGPNKEQCENLSFGVGSGSWSFVLACSWAGDFVADQDGKPNPSGPVTDPACIETLKGMGVDFDVLGQVQNGSYGGKTCMIENAVSLRGKAVPFGAKLTMTCDMAVAMEKWGQQMKGLGATSYYGIGSTRECGPMRDKNGNKAGTITEHALGRAVDVPGFIVGGRKVSMGSIFAPMTPDGVLSNAAKKFACGTFRGVLSPTYAGYVGVFVHFHVEWGAFNGCR